MVAFHVPCAQRAGAFATTASGHEIGWKVCREDWRGGQHSYWGERLTIDRSVDILEGTWKMGCSGYESSLAVLAPFLQILSGGPICKMRGVSKTF